MGEEPQSLASGWWLREEPKLDLFLKVFDVDVSKSFQRFFCLMLSHPESAQERDMMSARCWRLDPDSLSAVLRPPRHPTPSPQRPRKRPTPHWASTTL